MKRLLTCSLLAVLVAGLAAGPAGAGVIMAVPVTETGVNLSTTQTGNADSTNTLDRGYTLGGPVLLTVTTTVGATPTVTLNIKGSMDGSTFYNVGYALMATPETITVAAITITSATTNQYILRNNVPWRYLKLVYSANTNVTITADAYAGFGIY